MSDISLKSFRDFASETIANFLYREGFFNSEALRDGVTYLVNNIAAYSEEGVQLRPECIVTTDINLVAKVLPTHLLLPIDSLSMDAVSFHRGLKACAPLARDGWVVYFAVTEDRVEFGLLATGLAEPNPSTYSHLREIISDLEPSVTYLRCARDKVVLLVGRSNRSAVSFSLEHISHIENGDMMEVATAVVKSVDEAFGTASLAFFCGLIEQACEESHGCLIAVVDEYDVKEAALWGHVSNRILLPKPLSLVDLLNASQYEASTDAHSRLRAVSGVARRMMGHDGATVFTTDGRLVAYNCFVPTNDENTTSIVGGARSRAFEKLTQMEVVSCAFMCSHDGGTKVFTRNS